MESCLPRLMVQQVESLWRNVLSVAILRAALGLLDLVTGLTQQARGIPQLRVQVAELVPKALLASCQAWASLRRRV